MPIESSVNFMRALQDHLNLPPKSRRLVIDATVGQPLRFTVEAFADVEGVREVVQMTAVGEWVVAPASAPMCDTCPPSPRKLAPGNVVRLKSGGPLMTVTGAVGLNVPVVWFNSEAAHGDMVAQGQPNESVFPAFALELVPDHPANKGK